MRNHGKVKEGLRTIWKWQNDQDYEGIYVTKTNIYKH